MKTYPWIFFKTLCLSLIFFTLVSCSKKGSPGEQGPQGENANAILNGTLDPTASTGTEGDFYLNLQTKTLFGPKTNNSWGTGISLAGDKGSAGATILSGTSVPNISLGTLGDYYIDLTKMDFYGPKKDNSWGTSIPLIPKKPLEKRILVKPNFGYSKNCNICTQYVPANGTTNNSRYAASSGQEVISTGDISEYYENGIVTYEASINNGEWFLLNPDYSKPITNNFKVGNREYYTTFNPNLINYNKDTQGLTIALEREILVSGLYSEAQLITWLDTDMQISIRITLLPKDTVEYLAKQYPNQEIDQIFVLKYLQNQQQ